MVRPERRAPISSTIVAVDLGTTSCKAAIFVDGRRTASAARHLATAHPGPGRAEQDPEAWLDEVAATVREVCEATGTKTIDAVGLTAQSDSLVVAGPDGRSLRPSLLWMDARGTDEAAGFEQLVGRGRIHRHTGLRSAFNFTAPKAAWLREAEPAIFERTRWILQPKDYLHLRLTDAAITDPSSASRTLAYDRLAEAWWPEALEGFGLSPALFPAVAPSASMNGSLTRAAGRRLGLPAGTPVVLGAADRAAETLALGIAGSAAMVSTGTATGIVMTIPGSRDVDDDRITTPCHAVPGESLALLSIPTSGAIVEWLARVTRSRDRDPMRSLMRLAARSEVGAGGAIAVPNFMGARSFRWQSGARGALVGLQLGTSAGDIARAVAEGIAFEIAACLGVLRMSVGAIDRLVLTGGGYADAFACQLTADITGLPARRFGERDGALVGAMLLAGQAIGACDDAHAESTARVGRGRSFTPEPELHARYADLALRYEEAVAATIGLERVGGTSVG